MKKIKKIGEVVLFVLICQSAGIIGSFFTAPAISSWYANLNKPSFNPPSWVFGPAWTLLYTLMGIALYLIWQKIKIEPKAKSAVVLFFIHLIANALWSIIFFGLKNPLLALVEIILLWILIIAVIYKFYQINKTAGYLLLPYLLWTSFAAILNFSIWKLN